MEKRVLNIVGFKPRNIIVREATPVDDFHFEKIKPAHDGGTAVMVSNPLYVVFNAKRLSSFGDYNIQDWIESMNNIKSDPFSELRSKVSDEELVTWMRSRYVQKPSELAQWSAYLANNLDSATAELQAYVESQKHEQTATDVNDKQTNSE